MRWLALAPALVVTAALVARAGGLPAADAQHADAVHLLVIDGVINPFTERYLVDGGPAMPGPGEIPRLLQDDDLGFFVANKRGTLHFASTALNVTLERARLVGRAVLPSNDHIEAVLSRCAAARAERGTSGGRDAT